MQLSKLAVVAALAASTQAADEWTTEIPFITAFVADLKGNINDYLGLIASGSSIPPVLLSLYQEISSYTDDSYTTLIESDFPITALQGFVTGLPWYETRLSAELAAVATAAAETSSSAAESSSAAPTTSASSSAAKESSSAASSASSVASSIALSTEAKLSSSAVPTASASNGAPSINFVGKANGMIVVPLLAVSACALLL